MDPAAACLLPFHALAHGAVGRPGGGGLHRRHPGRRRSRPQRSAPARYWVTDDGLVVLASEVGVLDIDPAKVVRKGRLQPGRMFLVDTALGRIVDDDEIKADLPAEHPYEEWLEQRAGPPGRPAASHDADPAALVRRQPPAHCSATRPRSCVPSSPRWRAPVQSRSGRWATTPPSPCSPTVPGLLYDYFFQLFAQVTNPPLDAIREELVTSAGRDARSRAQPARSRPESCRQIVLPVSGHRQRRPGQTALHRRATAAAGLQGLRHRRPVRPCRGGRRR